MVHEADRAPEYVCYSCFRPLDLPIYLLTHLRDAFFTDRLRLLYDHALFHLSNPCEECVRASEGCDMCRERELEFEDDDNHSDASASIVVPY